jgi:hypothetical protein
VVRIDEHAVDIENHGELRHASSVGSKHKFAPPRPDAASSIRDAMGNYKLTKPSPSHKAAENMSAAKREPIDHSFPRSAWERRNPPLCGDSTLSILFERGAWPKLPVESRRESVTLIRRECTHEH